MYLVGVTSCPQGIAHTYMAADAMEKVCRKEGWEIKVEKQGQMGPENVLTSDEIERADAIVLANGITLVDGERFEGYEAKTVHISVVDALRKPDKLIGLLLEAGLCRK